jgi:hypothetical protein
MRSSLDCRIAFRLRPALRSTFSRLIDDGYIKHSDLGGMTVFALGNGRHTK